MAKQAKIYRQGDVWIYAITPKEYLMRKSMMEPAPITEKGLVLAEGEVTGHHHRIPSDHARRAILRNANPRSGGRNGARLLQVKRGRAVALVHEEHKTLQIPPGYYEVRIQREYSPGNKQVRVRD